MGRLVSIVFSLCFTFTFWSLSGQNEVTITVKDVTNGKPIEFANVYITPCDCGGITNNEGLISLTLSERNYKVVTSFIGYTADTMEMDLLVDKTYTVFLKSDGVTIGTVTVEGDNARGNIEKTVMGVQQLSIEKIKTLPTAIGEVDILRSLTMLSGVGSAGEASNGLSVRGGSLDQNLVLLDGAPVYNTTHLFGLFSIFTPDAVRNVELFQANMPSRYGGRISSIVDVQVESPNLDKLEIDGGVGLVSNRFAINTPIISDRLGVMFAGRVSYNDFLIRQIRRLKNTRASFIDGTLKLRYKLNDKNSLFYTSFYSDDFYQLELNTKINDIRADANQYDYQTLNHTLNWVRELDNGGFLQTTLTSSNYTPRIIFPQSEIDNKVTYSSAIRNLGLRSEYRRNFGNRIDFIAGLQVEQTTLSPGELLSERITDIQEQQLDEEHGLEGGIYVNLDYTVSEYLSLSGGIRYSYFALLGPYQQAIYADDFMREVETIVSYEPASIVSQFHYPEPRLGIRLKLNDNNSLKASYALTRQYLQNIYNSTTPLPTSRWKLADQYILPQTGQTASFGYYRNFLDDVWTIGLESYYRVIEDVIDYKPGADFFLTQFIEKDVVQGMGRNYGIELSLEKVAGKFNGWANYTYSRSLRRFESALISDRINNNNWFASDFDRPHVLNTTFNYEANPFNTFSVNFTYQTGRPFTIPNASIVTEGIAVPVFLERNNGRIPDYHRLDFSWRIHNITTKETRWKGDWIFTIYNLYSRNNAYNIYYAARDPNFPGASQGSGPLTAYQLSIFGTTLVSLGYNFHFE